MKKNTKPTPLDGLSARERQVLRLVVEGRTSKEIAGLVGIQPGTVDTYRSRIMAKLEIHDVPNLVRFAIRHGLIKL
jgi:DNA-binding CsgD family transcriptional regulator